MQSNNHVLCLGIWFYKVSNVLYVLFFFSQAYSVYDEEIGYCQGQSFLAAVLLLHVSRPVVQVSSQRFVRCPYDICSMSMTRLCGR